MPHPRIRYDKLLQSFQGTALEPWLQTLPDQIQQGLSSSRFGDLPDWLDALEDLPEVRTNRVELGTEVNLDSEPPLQPAQQREIRNCLEKLIPWRKGPYSIHGTHIDTEWRSDWKWDRVLPHLAPMEHRTILDVGCGNGYHCWRMLGAGAKQVIGIDPSPRFVVQFYMVKHFLGEVPVDLLPVGIEALPPNLQAFDTTFSMGVLYHRRSPMDHLRELKATLRPGGQLVLETLLINGKLGDVLVPEGRYAKMNNVWFLPSPDTLVSWLRKCGFKNPRLVDLNRTTLEEQRSTEWMRFHSLAQFLDPDNPELTAEGHPAPLRGVFVAECPG
ncbi:tRNA 5-methoxyuridine(34)/uridine 5-oxyacetic acid(34) synthase CmoB [Pseudomaricurvus alkylphenolicus]|uniref:tRNA 5-methoxyuridine(34)/uridine 5-oxyacetic acid(34) synthase CmoB n=1 Tax=Pseudomaricurvus alkylphenolicus TaxID=1306991 RepID=UPI001421F5CB|nr:tRNA 5-methoxyuridine(34)/uridine 5-oxyacetic acid(34) synthase CmoB [Pseudomaricurvus alkylphenolicus]NIB44549.1 tRNA 5-methoxyuridine(34)/uridine 5-oxyacetic acid(34) synthase CmoB [Pseudomaricurvus alkylphenolicus]